MNFWQCPHPAQYLKEICDTLVTVRLHCFVSMPARLIPAFQKELTSRWKQEYGGFLPLVQLDKDTALVDALSSKFDTGKKSPTLLDLKESMPMGTHTLAVVLPEHQYAAERELFRFLQKDAVAIARKRGKSGDCLGWNLLVIAPADRRAPGGGPGLRCFFSWGKLSHVDVECAIEAAFRTSQQRNGPQDSPDNWWLRPICRELAAGDPDLVETIWQANPKNLDALKGILAKHEFNTRDNGLLIRTFLDNARCMPARGERPHESAEELWHRGLLDRTVEGDIVLHPAGLLAAKREEELKRLIVRGQMQFFMPLVQEVHRLVRREVEQHFRRDLQKLMSEWKYNPDLDSNACNDNDDTKRKDPCREIGPLSHLLNTHNRKRDIPCYLRDAAKQWAKIRNTTAHCNVLTREIIASAFISYEELLEQCRNPLQATRSR